MNRSGRLTACEHLLSELCAPPPAAAGGRGGAAAAAAAAALAGAVLPLALLPPNDDTLNDLLQSLEDLAGESQAVSRDCSAS